MPRAPEGRIRDDLGRHFHVGIRQHNDGILRSALCLDSLAVRRGGGINIFRNIGRAYKCDGTNGGMFENAIHSFFCAVDEIDNALRETNLLDELELFEAVVPAPAEVISAAIEYLDRGLKVNEKNIALQLIKVQAFESLAKTDSAEAVFRRLIALYPETRALRHILAQFYLSHDRKDAAEDGWRRMQAWLVANGV